MLEQILAYLRNWFVAEMHYGAFEVKNGSIALPFLQEGQYYRVIGSLFNDGVYKYGASSGLIDEVFNGSVWALAIPPALLDVVKDIEAWETKNNEKINSPYQSESFGGYSYTLKNGGSASGYGWQSAFSARLNRWRKI